MTLFFRQDMKLLLIAKKNLVNCGGNVADVDRNINWKQQIKFAEDFLYLTEQKLDADNYAASTITNTHDLKFVFEIISHVS